MREFLRKKVSEEGLTNVSLPGAIDKRDIPAALHGATLLLMYSLPEDEIAKYGMSQNKLFDYLASGRPVLSNLPPIFGDQQIRLRHRGVVFGARGFRSTNCADAV